MSQPREHAVLCWCLRTTWNVSGLCARHQLEADRQELLAEMTGVDVETVRRIFASSPAPDVSRGRPVHVSPSSPVEWPGSSGARGAGAVTPLTAPAKNERRQ